MTIQHRPTLQDVKQHQRASWAAGDFPALARMTLWPVGERLVRRVGRGERVLDVACSTGNAARRRIRWSTRQSGAVYGVVVRSGTNR
jgi:hypothetical protein